MKKLLDKELATGVGSTLIVTILVVFLLLGACGLFQQQDRAKRVLEDQGYTDVEITGWRPFMADRNDTFSTGFKAISPSGAKVTGAVTGGFLKGSTIRLD